ncbi:hypothetical protein [Kineococcus aurantiacus]|uniref:FAD/FMN-containing dehydrogenase n=1 Tax=Kineococcus aurantiacus TaxID=37633 RepID=A0A7Y9DQW5_9ACTN|nr:hypothetical protein [Kineococcus aurantiacus]NYD25150.1 FAD/FMN-containing dehydrogenase [Kineococcus aurantiacus]
MVGATVVTASGEAEGIDSDGPRLAVLRASVGLLGVIVSIDLRVEPIFKLAETLAFWPFAEVLERRDEETHAHRHVGFVRMPVYYMSAVVHPAPGTRHPRAWSIRPWFTPTTSSRWTHLTVSFLPPG